MSSLFAELEPKRHKYTRRAVFRGDIVKDESGTNAAFFSRLVRVSNDISKSDG